MAWGDRRIEWMLGIYYVLMGVQGWQHCETAGLGGYIYRVP